MLPRMAGSETLTMLVSMISSSVASIIANTTTHWRRLMRNSAGAASADNDARLDGEADRQVLSQRGAIAVASGHVGRRVAPLDRDLDRYALHHLGEVARGVVGRDQRERRAGRRRDRLDVPVPDVAGERVHA